jgi:hypothetical protein
VSPEPDKIGTTRPDLADETIVVDSVAEDGSVTGHLEGQSYQFTVPADQVTDPPSSD